MVVGNLGASSNVGDMAVVDTLAFLCYMPFTIASVARPDSPRVVGTWNRGVAGLDAVGATLYAVGQYAQFWSLDMTDPTSPQPLDSLRLPGYDGSDVVVVGSTAYVGEAVIRLVDVTDPRALRLVGQTSVPYWTERLVYAAPFLYACCLDAGVCIFETTYVGVNERDTFGATSLGRLVVYPNPTTGTVAVSAERAARSAVLRDVAGREIRTFEAGRTNFRVDLTGLRSGLYFIELRGSHGSEVRKLIKR